MVVSALFLYLRCPVELLQKKDTTEFVRNRHVAKLEYAVCFVAHFIAQAKRSTNDKDDGLSFVTQ